MSKYNLNPGAENSIYELDEDTLDEFNLYLESKIKLDSPATSRVDAIMKLCFQDYTYFNEKCKNILEYCDEHRNDHPVKVKQLMGFNCDKEIKAREEQSDKRDQAFENAFVNSAVKQFGGDDPDGLRKRLWQEIMQPKTNTVGTWRHVMTEDYPSLQKRLFYIFAYRDKYARLLTSDLQDLYNPDFVFGKGKLFRYMFEDFVMFIPNFILNKAYDISNEKRGIAKNGKLAFIAIPYTISRVFRFFVGTNYSNLYLKNKDLRVNKFGLLDLVRPFMKMVGFILYLVAYETGFTNVISNNLEMQRLNYITQTDMQFDKNIHKLFDSKGGVEPGAILPSGRVVGETKVVKPSERPSNGNRESFIEKNINEESKSGPETLR